MAEIVAAISMSHAPGATGWPEAPETSMRARIEKIHADIARYLDDAKPDVIIAFLDDHFENHYRNLMPTFSIGIAPSHAGPADYMIKALGMTRKETIASDPELAESLLRELLIEGFDVARMGEIEYGNNLMTPLKLIRPEFDIPVVPFFTNVFTPPLTTMSRAFALGEAVRRVVEAYPKELRVALLATGGLSHWPPVWTSDSPADDEFLQRMKRYQTEGKRVLEEDPTLYEDLCKYEVEMAAKNQYPLNSEHPLINEAWDREIMNAFGQGDVTYLKGLTYDEIEKQGGHGGHEILNWMAVMGAVGGMPATVHGYEPVLEWICGMGYLSYDLIGSGRSEALHVDALTSSPA